MKISIVILVSLSFLSLKAQQINAGLDSVVRFPADTLQVPHAKLDSLKDSFHQKADSIANLQNTLLSKLFRQHEKLTQTTDSLNSNKLPADKYIQQKDSIEKEIAATVKKYESKVSDLKSAYTSKVEALHLPPAASAKMENLTKSIEGFQVPSLDMPNVNTGLPEMNLPDAQIPDMNLPDVNLPAGSVESINLPEANLPAIDGVSHIQQQVQDAIPGTDQLGNIKEVASVKDIDGASKLAEEKAAEQVKGLSTGSEELTQLQSLTSEDGAKEMIKNQAMEQIQRSPVDHFAGKEEILQKAMEDLSKLKSKYSNVSSLTDLTKKRYNEMRDKPFIERIIPGLGLQLFGGDNQLTIDFNPYAGYRLSGRLTSGIGWNQRVEFNTSEYNFTSASSVYGPRLFTEYNLGKGFFPRLEAEVMNTVLPAFMQTSQGDELKREWVFGMMWGMKKDYRITSRIRGTAALMFRLFNPEHKSPYKDVLNIRMGLEFLMKKKSKKDKAGEQ